MKTTFITLYKEPNFYDTGGDYEQETDADVAAGGSQWSLGNVVGSIASLANSASQVILATQGSQQNTNVKNTNTPVKANNNGMPNNTGSSNTGTFILIGVVLVVIIFVIYFFLKNKK
ncbi:MAG: LPXTG cell wall anchor domain-containing protein [Bacteroidetes bacterium]|nr:LPXTG cell wall anchor domain-containing protein [Bacteroidota bacterium]